MLFQSMPGAGGLLATNYFYAQAPADGTVLGLIHSSVPLAPLFGTKGARFDPLKINWIGSLDRSDGPCTSWHTSPVKTWDDMLKKEFIVGSSGVGSQMDIYPAVMNKLFNTKIRVIGGYKDGALIFQAMENGEVHGRCGPQFTSIQSIRPHWLTEKKIAVPIVVSERRSPLFPDSPSIMEFAKDEPTRQQLRLLILTQDLDRPVLAPPGVPPARVKLLRDAFNATMADPAFLADVKKQRLTLDWVRGEEVAKTLAAAYAMPPDVVAAARQMMAGK
jgi:tripartite-type tricarboxylate transporter receptor subunit TctC